MQRLEKLNIVKEYLTEERQSIIKGDGDKRYINEVAKIDSMMRILDMQIYYAKLHG